MDFRRHGDVHRESAPVSEGLLDSELARVNGKTRLYLEHQVGRWNESFMQVLHLFLGSHTRQSTFLQKLKQRYFFLVPSIDNIDSISELL